MFPSSQQRTAKTPATLRFIPNSICRIALLCVTATLLASGCGGGSSSNSADNKLLAQERTRIEAEKRAEREAEIQKLLARNVPAETNSEGMWAGFRRANPYHSQVLALSGPSADNSRTLIVSEPPTHVTAGDILFSVGDILKNHSEQKQKIGYDGWVKDLVIEVAGDQPQIDRAINSLNRLLFHTSYKSYVMPLPARPSNKANFNLDLQVTSAELKSWVVDGNETFAPVEGGDSLSLQQLFEEKLSGVFYADGGGVVCWWLPKGRTVDDSRIEARQFSLDSDLVLGAISNPKGILIFGRERVVPVDILPPLRVETFQLLAAVQQGQSGELQQSYERNRLFAGRIGGSQDWAPILLSPELRDTEYGSLLNITDQLLKGWSNNGNTSYYNFNYPRPKIWPFKGSLMSRLDTNELTYNWNTRGAGYTIDAGNYSLMALNRTGALPVSYIPEGSDGESESVLAAEEEAYNYFARLNDPNLVRVVQYAAMYQIFSAFDVAKPSSPVPSTKLPDQKLEELTNGLLAEIQGASPREIEAMTRQLAPLVGAQLNNKQLVQRLLGQTLSGLRQEASEALQSRGYVQGTPEYNAAMSRFLSYARSQLQSKINGYIAQQKTELNGQIKDQLQQMADGTEPADEEAQAVRTLALSQFALLRKLPERYAEAAGTNSSGWIHTPAVVVSFNVGSLAGAVGGHNLGAKVTRFRVSDDVIAGTTRVDDAGNILVNPKDISRVNKVVRTAGRAEGETPYRLSSRLDSALKSVSEAPPRGRAEALNLSSSPPLPPQGPPRPPLSFDFPVPDSGGGAWRAGWARPRSQLPGPDPLIARLSQRQAEIPEIILIERNETGLISIANSVKSPTVRASTPEDAADFVIQLMRKSPGDKGPLKIEFRGFSEGDTHSFIKTCEVRASSERIPREISGVVDDAGNGTKGPGGGNGPRGPNPPDEGGPGNGRSNGPGDRDGMMRRNSGGDDAIALAVRRRRFDFSKAEVKVDPDIVTVGNRQVSTIRVEVPAADAGTAGRSTIRLGFRQSTPREVVSAATNRVSDSVRNFIRGIRDEYDALRFNLRLNSEVKRVSREMEIDIDLIRHSFGDGRGDLYFARRKEESGEPPAPDTAACQSA